MVRAAWPEKCVCVYVRERESEREMHTCACVVDIAAKASEDKRYTAAVQRKMQMVIL